MSKKEKKQQKQQRWRRVFDNTWSWIKTDSEKIVVDGIVVKVHWWVYDVAIEQLWDIVISAYASWKMKKNTISIIEEDKVQVELSPYDPTKWRIVFRYRK